MLICARVHVARVFWAAVYVTVLKNPNRPFEQMWLLQYGIKVSEVHPGIKVVHSAAYLLRKYFIRKPAKIDGRKQTKRATLRRPTCAANPTSLSIWALHAQWKQICKCIFHRCWTSSSSRAARCRFPWRALRRSGIRFAACSHRVLVKHYLHIGDNHQARQHDVCTVAEPIANNFSATLLGSRHLRQCARLLVRRPHRRDRAISSCWLP